MGLANVSIGAEADVTKDKLRPRKQAGPSQEQPGKSSSNPKSAPELCNEAGDGKYSAVWQKGKVTLTASGSHRTAGYRVLFEQTMLMIYPPQFSLKHQAPSGMAAAVITPFSVTTSFKADEKPQAIIVHDAKGQKRVPVR